MPVRLPIDEALPAILDTLANTSNLVLQAPPGAGKTTRVPLVLLRSNWLADGRVVMLEPRRLAARAAASYMARQLGESVGETVGYRIRLDTRVGPRTRVEVVTEGVLTRMLQDDPTLAGVQVLIFDEFHERSLHADLGLALALQTQKLVRPELRIIVMSATLDTGAVAQLLGDAPVIRSEGRAYPVATVLLSRRHEGRMEDLVANTISRAITHHEGDVLAFLPGAAEIRRTAERLDASTLPAHTEVHPLYGDLPQDAQERAIAPSPPGRRKVVLATSIAETSLTIEGVRIVVDSGLMRVPRFSPRTGMTRLATVPVSRAAADQRRGRAGRLGPGFCYRLWTDAEDSSLLAHRPPEILDSDLAPLALELAAGGVREPTDLRWIDPPPAASFAQARELLRELEAFDAHDTITAHGRALVKLALHPRLAHMLLRAQTLGYAALACDLAALLAERDVLRANDSAADPDVRLRLPLLRGAHLAPPQHRIDYGALQRAQAEARHWRARLRIEDSAHAADESVVGLLLALAYPDRIGQRKRRGRFLLRNGRAAAMDVHHPLAQEEYIVAAEVGGHGRDTRIFLAAPFTRSELEQHFANQLVTDSEVSWDTETQSVRAIARTRLGALVITERAQSDASADDVVAALLFGIRRTGLHAIAVVGGRNGVASAPGVPAQPATGPLAGCLG